MQKLEKPERLEELERPEKPEGRERLEGEEGVHVAAEPDDATGYGRSRKVIGRRGGGGRGIGASIVRSLVRLGAHVSLLGRTAATLEALSAELKSSGAQTFCATANIA
ncbi:MAG: SDR family NAD(P)-dependent oxidoreductase, partial [Acidobacteriota bacterium]|nr:SDR family NAD(P)-dependent oxidoreductase [Acidobacteriota bacterium]